MSSKALCLLIGVLSASRLEGYSFTSISSISSISSSSSSSSIVTGTTGTAASTRICTVGARRGQSSQLFMKGPGRQDNYDDNDDVQNEIPSSNDKDRMKKKKKKNVTNSNHLNSRNNSSSSSSNHDDDNNNIQNIYQEKQDQHNTSSEIMRDEMLLQRDAPFDADFIHGENLDDTEKPGDVSVDAKVKRKKKNGSSQYRTLDNRDSLPFLVKVSTPDPYTNNEQMKREAKLNTERAKKSSKKNGGKDNVAGSGGKVRHNLVGMGGIRDSITSSIYSRADDGSMHKIIGEFALDKSTNCGDIIEVGDGTQYQVQKARCQYKYVGKQFVMVRKILEVKEIRRILVENEVRNLFEKQLGDVGENNDPSDTGLMLE